MAEPRTRWGTVVIALGAGYIAAGHVGKLPPALPMLRAELGLDLIAASWVASVFSITGMVVAVLLGATADRIGHWRLSILGLALLIAGGVGGSLASGVLPLLVSRFVEGIGFLAVVVAAPSLIAHATHGRDRQMALGFWAGYLPVGVTVTILAAPAVLGGAGWQGLWLLVAAFAGVWLVVMAAAVMAAAARRAPPHGAARHRAAPVWRNIRLGVSRLGPWVVAACFVLYASQLYAIITWLPTFMIEERGMAPGTAAALTALVVAVNGMFSFLAGWLLHRGTPPWLLLAVSGAVMTVAALGAFSDQVPDLARYVLCLLLAGVGGVVASAAFAVAPSFAPSPAQVGTINGILVQASSLGQFLGPPVMAAVVSAFGTWESALWMMVGANVLLAALALSVRHLARGAEA